MGLLDMLFGGNDQPQQNSLPMDELRQLGLSDGLINYYQQEQAKAQKAAMWNNAINGVANIASGAQGMGPRFGGAGDGSGGGSGGPGANTPLSLDGLVDRALKFSQIRQAMMSQQNIAQIRQAIASDPNLSAQEKQAYATNPEAYLKLIEKGVERRTAPDDLDIKYDPDNRVVGAFNKKTQTMLSPEEAANRGINYATGAPPSKLAESENQLLGNYMSSPEVKTYASADPIYRSIVKSATTDTGASDLDMVYGIAKILDPTSVVREGEIQMAGSTGGTVALFQGLINQINGGAKLPPETRARLLEMAQNRMGELRGAHDQVVSQLDQISGRRGLNKDNIVTRRYDPLPDAPIYSAKRSVWIPNGAIAELRNNPTADEIAIFDDAFGAGSARRALGVR